MGVLSALPFVSAANLCCCLWVVGGGLVAAYVRQQNESTAITPADGSLVGLLAGLLGAVIQVLVSIPITFVVAPMERALLQRVIDMAGTMPEDMRQMVEQYGDPSTRVSRAGNNARVPPSLRMTSLENGKFFSD